ncbi:MAG TPA: leucyl aminopeptidase family protein [Alphaproteobacteria bacterium]|nr:leucyl aminopeptidase family protein [Alphaproteobacteria bacterium]
MTSEIFDILALPDLLQAKGKDKTTPIHFIKASTFEKWVAKQPLFLQNQFKAKGWTAKDGTHIQTLSTDGTSDAVYIGHDGKISLYTVCAAAEKIGEGLYEIEGAHKQEELENICIGWLLAAYQFDHYKKSDKKLPHLLIPKGVNKTRIDATARAAYLARNLINLPPNALGPRTLAGAIEKVGKNFGALIRITEDESLIEENLPLIYAVGHGSDRRPCLTELAWGNPKHPKVTLVGKGVCFDTGGYDLKPSAGMLLMKKDMAGAAIALGTALMIMSLKLPVYLRLLIPCVENSVSGRAYRPSDILTARNGKTIEIGNTDAEGRLVLADCLALACEEEPDLLVDFATLTGAAHYAVGPEIGIVYSNDEKLGHDIQNLSIGLDDPLWNLPLWQNYKKDIISPVADINNSGSSSNPAGSITAALFLEHFVTPETTWVHLDQRSWQNTPQPGRSQGGKEMGMRTIFTLIEQKYAPAKKKTASKQK